MSALPRFWAALILFIPLLVGCGKEEGRSSAELGSGDLRWASFPVEVQADSFLLLDSRGKRDLYDAMDFWERRAGKQLFVLTGEWNNADLPYRGNPENPDQILANVIYLQGPWPYDQRVAGKTLVHSTNNVIEHAVVLLNTEKNLCSGDCWGQDDLEISRRKLIAHELGHFLGFGHSSDMGDLMYPEILSGGSLDHVEVNEALLTKLTD